MAGLPNPKSYEQIIGDMLSTYMSKIGVNDLNTGSAVTSFFEAMAQAVYRSSGDIFSILRDFSVDRAEGEALKRLAEEERVYPIPARVATGRVTITDTSFEKIATKVYAGTAPPNIGSTIINVSDASLFPASGQVYIGRGTPNVEGPISYTSITPVGSYFQINLAAATTRYHNNSEDVVLAQGGVRTIAIGTSVRTAESGSSPNIVFSVTREATILDGEAQVTNVPVAADTPGTNSNIPRNAIRDFVSSPFTGATVTNPNPFTTGRNEETDEEIRIRIKRARISKGLGTAVAIKSAVIGAQASDENAIVASNEIVSTGDKTTLFIDNGSGYEEKTAGVGLEFVVDSALGGEQFFQLAAGGAQTSIAKATLTSGATAPFNINPTNRLAILVGGVLSEHTFQEGDFRSNGSATAYEVVASINSNSDLDFSARTVENGTKVALSAKEEDNEFIQKTAPTVGTDAGVILNLSLNEVETLKLYKNRQPLSRNGRSAVIESENQSDWASTMASGETLIVAVDGTAAITYTFLDDDFATEGTYATLSNTNSLQSWVNVINNKVTGVTATINGSRILITSNLGTNSRASVVIDPASTLVGEGMFTVTNGLSAFGLEADFSLSRNTRQIRLNAPLEPGDSLTAGSDQTEATVLSGSISGGSVTLTSDADLWFLLDNQSASIITHTAIGNGLVTVSQEAGSVLRLTSTEPNVFSNVESGDYMILWSTDLSFGNRVEGRVSTVGSVGGDPDNYVEIRLTPSEYATTVAEGPLELTDGLTFLRSEVPPQKIQISAGTYPITNIASQIQSQLLGGTVSTENDEFLVISTNSKSSDGSVLVVTVNDPAKVLGFTTGEVSESNDSLIGFVTQSSSESALPLFVHSTFSSNQSADPINSFIASATSTEDLTALGLDPNARLVMAHPFLYSGSQVLDAQAAGESILLDDFSGTALDFDESKTIRRIRANDRYHLLNTLDLTDSDKITVVLDGQPSTNTFPVNLYRTALTNASMPINSDQFRAFDSEAGASTEFTNFFGADYSFKNYKALMKAKNVIDPSTSANEDAILYRSSVWGSAGEKYKVGYFYPTAANSGLAHSVSVGETVDIQIFLQSGGLVADTIDGSTEWDVSVTPNTPVPGMDEVTYAWNGTGTNPSLTTLLPGHYVTITPNFEFSLANTGTFKISSATSTSFTVLRPNGVAVSETGRSTITAESIVFYEDLDTPAADIVDYVNTNLSSYMTAELIDDAGLAGAGVIDTSTYEDNAFAVGSEYVQLVDGLNWIAVSNLSAAAPTPQFELKRSLSLPSFDTNTAAAYAFNDGEEIKLVPTEISQVAALISVLAVSGITTLSEVSTFNRDQDLQIATNVLGSSGSVLVSGGSGNSSGAQILGITQRVGQAEFIKTSITRSASTGFLGDSWVKLEAANFQRKDTTITNLTAAEVTSASPTPTSSIIELLGGGVSRKYYFGEPRNFPRLTGRAFQVEKQGSLVCITWDGITGADPLFSKTVDLNGPISGNFFASFNTATQELEIVTSGSNTFSEVKPGDTVTITGFAEEVNNGTFTVTGASDNTLAVDNTSGVSTLTQVFGAGDIVVTAEIKEGDTVEIGTPFASLNQGRYRVVRRFNNSIYIENSSAVEERVVLTETLRPITFTPASTQFLISAYGPANEDSILTWNGVGDQPDFSSVKAGDIITLGPDFLAGNQGSYMVTKADSTTINFKNASRVLESGVTISPTPTGVLKVEEPAMKFYDYNDTVPGDKLVISGSVLGSSNIGSRVITEVLDRNRVVVSDIMTTAGPTNLNAQFPQIYVEEGVRYTGYKQIHTIATNPLNALQKNVVFNSSAQLDKINQAAGVTMTSLGKLNLPEGTVTGFDAYKYHTGLLAEANRIVYGDPADNTTYPGVAAAGAEIFIEPPLVKRIQVSINIRVNTGVPFVRVAEEVRNAIASLINASPIGVSIAISDIISDVNSIPGVRAVSISSPAYDPTNDVIVVNPAEKPFILDIVNDIDVSKVG